MVTVAADPARRGTTGAPMSRKQAALCERLKKLGFVRQNQMMLYGYRFEFVSDPIVIADSLIFVDAIEKNSMSLRRVRIPLTILNTVNGS
jgi:hypothetical protein